MSNSGHVDGHCPRQLMFAALVIPVGLAAGPRSSSCTRRGADCSDLLQKPQWPSRKLGGLQTFQATPQVIKSSSENDSEFIGKHRHGTETQNVLVDLNLLLIAGHATAVINGTIWKGLFSDTFLFVSLATVYRDPSRFSTFLVGW